MAKREYMKSDASLTIYWNSDLCSHCENCWRSLPSVFDPKRRPWVDANAADSDEIARVVNECPSGAISLTQN
jgi:uncharacterized Fe-S cluster protein YjdI